MSIKLVAVDLDGTLLNSAKQITAKNQDALDLSREIFGVAVVLASARPPRSVRPFYQQLRLDTPTINYNGALVVDPSSQEVLLHRPLPLEVARRVVTTARKVFPQVLISAEVMDKWYTDRYDDAYDTETARTFEPDVVAPIDSWLDQPVTKLLLLGRQDRLAAMATALRRRLAYQITQVQTEDNLLQIMHATVSKAQALRVVAAHMHVPREQVLAIGDNANDVGMLQWAGLSVAMANAAEPAKAVADHVTDGHDADGVAKAIRCFILDAKGQ